MSRTWIRLLVALCVAVLVIGAAIAAWKVPFLGQTRLDRSVATLVWSGSPGLPGPWRQSYVEGQDMFSPWGLEQRGTRVWQRADGVEVEETIRRFSSPRWASWTFDRDTPQEQNAEYFDSIIEVTPTEPPAGTDGLRYFCGRIRGRPGTCDNWWVWLRDGQYVLELATIDAPSTSTEIPAWLQVMVRDTHRVLITRAPKQ